MKTLGITAATIALSILCFAAGYQTARHQLLPQANRFAFFATERTAYRGDLRTGEMVRLRLGKSIPVRESDETVPGGE